MNRCRLVVTREQVSIANLHELTDGPTTWEPTALKSSCSIRVTINIKKRQIIICGQGYALLWMISAIQVWPRSTAQQFPIHACHSASIQFGCFSTLTKFFVKYRGRFLVSLNTLPKYSPSSPMAARFRPPKKSMATICEA